MVCGKNCGSMLDLNRIAMYWNHFSCYQENHDYFVHKEKNSLSINEQPTIIIFFPENTLRLKSRARFLQTARKIENSPLDVPIILGSKFYKRILSPISDRIDVTG